MMNAEPKLKEPVASRSAAIPDDSIATRATLLKRLCDREDRESWQEFFETYWSLIYRVARRAGLSDADAQDVVQETVISVARKIDGFVYDPKIGSFKAWMLHVTRWRILDRLRRLRRDAQRQHLSVPAETSTRTATIERVPDPQGVHLDSVWDREWEANLLQRALEQTKRQVSPDAYQIYDYCVHEEMAPRKVSRLLGVSMAKVYLTRHRVERALRRELEKLHARLRLQDELR